MTSWLPPKHRGTAWAVAIAVMAVVALVGVMGATTAAGPDPRLNVGAATTPLAVDAETRRVELALAELRRMAREERLRPMERASGSQRIVALHVPRPVDDAQLPALPALDFSKTSLVILQTRHGASVVVDGIAVTPGQSLPGGERLRSVERTALVVEDRAGRSRRIDLRDGFDPAPPAAAPSPAPHSTPAPASSRPQASRPPPTPAMPPGLFPAS